MQAPFFAVVASEDQLSETVCETLISAYLPKYTVNLRLRKQGFGYLRSRIDNFQALSRTHLVFLLTDLDSARCAPSLQQSWLRGRSLGPNFLFRVAIREVESWLLADEDGIRSFLKIKSIKLPANLDTIENPKQTLLRLALKSPKAIRDEVCAPPAAAAVQGPGYNIRLGAFVKDAWNHRKAAGRSESLRRTVRSLSALQES
jgi:hypothetical protein